MNRYALLTFSTLAAAVAMTLYGVALLKPSSAGAWAFFSLWLVSPYVAMGVGLAITAGKSADTLRWHLIALLVSALGIAVLADVIWWHRDAQGAIAVLLVPVLQLAAWTALVVLAWWVSHIRARARARRPEGSPPNSA